MGKIKLNKDGLKGIFINHVEKMVLGVVLLVFVVFVYASVGLEGLPSNETPDALIQSAQNAEKSILDPVNAKEVLSTVTVSSGYVERAKEGQIPTDAVLYANSKPPTPYWGQDGTKRQDPQLFPPEKPEVVALAGGVAVVPTGKDDDPLFKEKNSVVKPKEDKRKRKKNEYDPYGVGGEMDAYGEGGGLGMPSSGAMAGMGDPGMGMMDSTGIMANPADRVGFVAMQGAVAQSRNCIAVKLIVPWKKQWEEYQAKFSGSLGFNPARDTPNYLSFTAERIEVPDDPTTPLDWSKAQKIWTQKIMDELPKQRYVGFGTEVADPRYLYMGFLTFPLPPFINRDLEPLALHADVPKLADSMIMPMQGNTDPNAEEKDAPTEPNENDLPADAPGRVVPGTMSPDGGYAGAEGGGMMAGGMMSGGGMMGGAGIMGGAGMMQGGMMSGEGMGMAGMGMSGMGMSGMGMAGMGRGGEMESGGYGSAYAGMDGGGDMYGGMGTYDPNVQPGPPVPYLLIRFFDFNVVPGKKYRYRVQTIVEDPNHPMHQQMEPSDRYLDDEVKKRLADNAAREKSTNRRIYFQRTEWSEPSEPVSVDIKPQSLAGTIDLAKFVLAPEINPGVKEKMMTDEPTAKLMSVMWDPKYATEVSGVSNVLRGTFLNFTANGDAIHPVLLVYKSLEKYNFRTNRLVADIRGGEELAGAEREVPLVSPAQVALMDENGQIVVRTEFEDWDQYRKLALPDLPDPMAAGGYDPAGGYMEESGGLDGGYGMPQGRGGAAPRGRSGS